jgi:prevent-host-death family protein
MAIWPVQEAKAKFSAMLDACLKDGPQIVTRRGAEAAVLAPIEEWRRIQRQARPGLKDLLLGDGPRFEFDQPLRGRATRRDPIAFD